MSLFDIQHQDRACDLIQRALSAERMPHAYIFHGPDGVGKETLALGLAGILLCHNAHVREAADSGEGTAACGKCNDCTTCRAGTHPDLHLVYRQLNKYHEDAAVRRRKALDLGVDVVRQFVIDKVGHKPIQGKAKVFIIREADRITDQAQNALLKTLEEPPDTTFIILLVSSLDRLLPTTRSRCQLIPFGALPDEFVADKLRGLADGLSEEEARLIARLSQGSIGDALCHAQDGLAVCNSRLVETLTSLSGKTIAQVVGSLDEDAKALGEAYRRRDPEISETEAQRRAIKTMLGLAATWYRDVLHVGCGSSELIANVAADKQLTAAARATNPDRAALAIQQLAECQAGLDANVNAKLALDNVAIQLTRLATNSA